MVSTSGARLLQPAAEKILREKLLPLATLVTPNLDEAEILAGMKLRSPEDMREPPRENSFPLRLRGAGQRRPFEKFPRGDGHFLRRQNRTAVVRAVRAGRFHARHRLHLFRRDLRRARARPRFAARGGDRKRFHHGGHCRQLPHRKTFCARPRFTGRTPRNLATELTDPTAPGKTPRSRSS